MRVLVIGSGGREHCLAWKLKESSQVREIYCAPGNGGTSLIAQNVEISPVDISGLLSFVSQKRIDFTVVGPEAPLAEGIVDAFEEKGFKIFGPRKELARLESSKVFAKKLLKRYHIPTAQFEIFDNPEEAVRYIEDRGAPIVVKADGLAGGKGAFVCPTIQEAKEAVKLIMVDKKFGASGDKVVVEEYLEGEEASILAFIDSRTILPLVSSQDHKRIFDGDRGPNTGGMGAYAPALVVTPDIRSKIETQIFKPLIEGLRNEGRFYKGILYAGLMIREDQPYVLEFNVRFGDPETQAILPKLKSDLGELILRTIEERLGGFSLEWDERFCLCVVLASGGYPGSYQKGKVIEGLTNLEDEDIKIFHAGTKRVKKEAEEVVLSWGGRVLNVAGLGRGILEAKEKVYKAIEKIRFEGMHYRRDIGDKALERLTAGRRRLEESSSDTGK